MECLKSSSIDANKSKIGVGFPVPQGQVSKAIWKPGIYSR